MRSRLSEFGAAMGTSGLRFYAIEHAAFCTAGSRPGAPGQPIHAQGAHDPDTFCARRVAVRLALVLIVLAIPWPSFDTGRSLLPGFLMP